MFDCATEIFEGVKGHGSDLQRVYRGRLVGINILRGMIVVDEVVFSFCYIDCEPGNTQLIYFLVPAVRVLHFNRAMLLAGFKRRDA